MMVNKGKYEDFKEEDFLNDEYFQEWIIKPDEEKNKFWKDFILLNAAKAEAVRNAGAMLRSIQFVETWPADEKVEKFVENAMIQIRSPQGRDVAMFKEAKIRTVKNRWWMAAAIIFLITAGSYLLLDKRFDDEITSPNTDQPVVIQTDIAPGSNKAILTLADGTELILDTVNNGAITKQGNVTVINMDGQLSYNKEGDSKDILYNTITTPKGGQYQLVLADGSKVWLNAASSIRFPASFVGDGRHVSIAGEAYFEVAHDASKPFHVSVNGMDVQVLGTHFNINSYSDEETIKTTLLEGRIKISMGDKSQIVNPGQQAEVFSNEDIKLWDKVDVDAAVAWKNGFFAFKNADIKTVMRQLSKWYDIEVVYRGKIPDQQFSGEIGKNLSLKDVLEGLAFTSEHFKIEDGRKLIILP